MAKKKSSMAYLIEKNLKNSIIKDCSEYGMTMFNNPVGTAWVGAYNPVMRAVLNPQPITYGLTVGSSDLIGITPIKITEDMVGKTVGVFTGIEVKLDKNGHYGETTGQRKFGEFITKNGGFYILADCFDDVVNFFDAKGLTVIK